MKPKQVLVNGLPSQNVSVLDRGLQFGDGLFETLISVDGTVLHWPYHLERLQEGASKLQIPISPTDIKTFYDWACQQSDGDQAQVLKWIMTRGETARGYAFPESIKPTHIYESFPYVGFVRRQWEQGIKVRVSDVPITQNSFLAGIKHLNRLDSVMAKMLQPQQVDEVLLAKSNGEIVEATMGNVFWFEDGQWWTPPLDCAGVNGIIRRRLLKTGQTETGLAFGEKVLNSDSLAQTSAAFVCNVVLGAWPIRGVDSEPPNKTKKMDWKPLRMVQRLIYDWGYPTNSEIESILDEAF